MIISKGKIKKYSLLRQKKYREKEGLFLVQGEKAVKDTIGRFDCKALIVKKNTDFPVPDEIKEVYEATEDDLRKISTLENTPNVIAVYRIPEKDESLEVESDEFHIVLDGVQDPGNLGTIIRTAHWFGIKNIFCSKDTVDVYNPKVVLATMGSIAAVNVVYCDLNELFQQNSTTPVYGLLLDGRNLFELEHVSPGFILMGSEGHGPREETLAAVTEKVTIPPANPTDSPDSLNVAIASAITISQFLK